jgi:hypothetical protein
MKHTNRHGVIVIVGAAFLVFGSCVVSPPSVPAQIAGAASGAGAQSGPGLIQVYGKPIFLSGMNLSWMMFAADLENLNTGRFQRAVGDIAAAGGNTLRWWLHINGSLSPQFDSKTGLASGISDRNLANLKKALDIAAEGGVGLILCLWSFNMLEPDQKGVVDVNRNLKLLTTDEGLQAYIDKALVPMVRSVKDHPGLIAWEVFNEPEGMCENTGWTSRRITLSDVQRVVNRVAGAIHREAPGTLVTNGIHKIKYAMDIGGFFNYYRDDRLIGAGGDKDGTLDFFSVHFYPAQSDESLSPFHHPASYWRIDKPLVIGEFPAAGIVDLGSGLKVGTTLTPAQAYAYAFDNGYAGALGWKWTGDDGFGGVADAAPGMKGLQAAHPDAVKWALPMATGR